MDESQRCPRQCGAQRERESGVCRVPREILVARAAPHFGEEPCLSGERGSGTVFFAGCLLGCVYCQNFDVSRARKGVAVSEERLAEIFCELEAQGVHNLNLVTGTPYVRPILDALKKAQTKLPVVWNTSAYETPETLRMLEDHVQIYLPDMKYRLSAPAARYSAAPDYPEVAEQAIREMLRQTETFRMDENGLLQKGVLIRHLVLPGQKENTRRVIEWVAEAFFPGEVLFSLMAQYTPCGNARRYPEINRLLSPEEWGNALCWLEEAGIKDGYVQDLSASGEEEIPDFTGRGRSS